METSGCAELTRRSQARFLRYLDVSENMIDKRAADHLVQALTPHLAAAVPASPAPPPAEEAPSEKEEPDEVEEGGEKDEEEDGEYLNAEPLFKGAPLLKKDDEAPEAGVVMSIRLENCGLKGAALEAFGAPIHLFRQIETKLTRPMVDSSRRARFGP